MAVEALFWFHPMVWWIGSRLVDERERACDEEVVRLGNEPHVYAESILKTCQFHIESPLSCVSGVTGSNLTRRIERIMADRPRPGVRAWPGTLLLMAASMALVAPVVVGALGAPAFPAAIDSSAHERPSFDEAIVSPNATGGNLRRVSMLILPDGTWEATNVTLESMIRMSYRLQESQLIGGPAWMYTDRFDIRAKSDASGSVADVPLRVQSLLAERFNLRVHDETRDLPIYSLVIDRNDLRSGPRLMRAAVDCAGISRTRREMAPIEPRRPDGRPTCGTIIGMGRLSGGGVTMPQIAQALSQYTGRTVIDRSGLSGTFDYDLEFTPNPAVRGSGSNAGNSIFTAVREQLGLRLDAQRGPVSVVVIDSVQQPVKN
jgi:uncharacterized protein (TIGR03435 family)